jgi:hypothetical protein
MDRFRDGIHIASLEGITRGLEQRCDPGDAMYDIARGALEITVAIDSKQVVVDVLGGGDVVGEMALLTGAPRTAGALALTSVTLGKIDRQRFSHLAERVPGLLEEIWKAFAERVFDNYLRDEMAYSHLTHADRLVWFRSGRFTRLDAGELASANRSERTLFLVHGVLGAHGDEWHGPTLIRISEDQLYTAAQPSAVCLLPEPRVTVRRSEVPGRA